MQILVFVTYFSKVIEENLWGFGSTPPPIGTGRVKIRTGFAQLRLKEKSSQLFSSCANIIVYTIGKYLMKFARAPRLSYQWSSFIMWETSFHWYSLIEGKCFGFSRCDNDAVFEVVWFASSSHHIYWLSRKIYALFSVQTSLNHAVFGKVQKFK